MTPMKRSSRGSRQAPAQRLVACRREVEQEARHPAVVARPLVAVGPRLGSTRLTSRVAVPVGRGGDGAGVGAEADQRGLVAPALAHELADVVLAPHRPISVARASPMWLLCAQTSALASGPPCSSRCVERVGHVLVAQVPAFGAAVVHDPVVLLGRRDQARVHRRVEQAVAVAVIERFVEQVAALRDDRLLALAR